MHNRLPREGYKPDVIHLGITDHSLVFLTHKAHDDRNGPHTIEIIAAI